MAIEGARNHKFEPLWVSVQGSKQKNSECPQSFSVGSNHERQSSPHDLAGSFGGGINSGNSTFRMPSIIPVDQCSRGQISDNWFTSSRCRSNRRSSFNSVGVFIIFPMVVFHERRICQSMQVSPARRRSFTFLSRFETKRLRLQHRTSPSGSIVQGNDRRASL